MFHSANQKERLEVFLFKQCSDVTLENSAETDARDTVVLLVFHFTICTSSQAKYKALLLATSEIISKFVNTKCNLCINNQGCCQAIY